MKLNWFSPLPPAKTDIAHYTLRILSALKAHADVTLWTDQTKWDSAINDIAEVRRYQVERMPWAEINRADMSVYNIGNNPIFHGSIWEVSQRHPGIVVLHDSNLHELFYNLYLGQWRDPDAYLAQMEFYYGEAGRHEAEACLRNKGQLPYGLIERYPLTLLALENALGALTHTKETLNTLKRGGNCPVIYAPLPFTPMSNSRQGEVLHSGSRQNRPPYRLIIFGHLSRNRRLDEFLQALAELDEKERFHLDVYGELLDKKHLFQLVELLNLEKLVTIHGFVTETELERALALAHLAINLRYPTMGEASGSQLRILSHALPSLVTRVGWYAELPEDSVVFVRPAHEREDIKHRLKEFLADPDRFAVMGRRGLELYQQYHLPEKYVEAVMRLAEAGQSFRPVPAVQRLMLKARSEMERWMQPASPDPHPGKLAAKNARLIYGRSAGAPATPGSSLMRSIKRFIKRRLPHRVYAYLKERRERLRRG
jgi:glycosyltransferase involved in cell wall biosynthesis